MKQVGEILEIWRYPVKGMAGEKLLSGRLGRNGVEGDRVWAVRDLERREIQSCKFRPQLLGCTVSTREGGQDVDIQFPDGDVIGSDEVKIHGKISELLGYESELVRLKGDMDPEIFRRYKGGARGWLNELKETFTREEGEAMPDFTNFPIQAQENVTLPGTFFLVSPFHLMTTASLEYLAGLNPVADWDVRRFRPNVLVRTLVGEAGLVEQGWIGDELRLGKIGVKCAGTAIRCGAVTREQRGVPQEKTVLRTIVKEAEQNLGIYGDVKDEGQIRVGDCVALV